MSKQTATILITALISSIMFISVMAVSMDMIFMFLCTLPLFAIGLSKDPRMALKAGALATLPIALLTGSSAAVLIFFLGLVLPAWYICDMALHYYDLKLNQGPTPLPTLRLWYPVGLITIHMALYACAILAIITMIFASQDVNLPQHMSGLVSDEVVSLNSEYQLSLDMGSRDLSFMICAMVAWLWAIFLLGHAWITNRSLAKKNIARRPNLMITPFPIPNWLLTLMSICALASLVGGQSISFLGKGCLIILLLPYFFQGAALLHIRSIKWPNRRVFLLFMYIFVLFLFWPALLVAGIGLWDHIKILNKRLSSGGSSSKS